MRILKTILASDTCFSTYYGKWWVYVPSRVWLFATAWIVAHQGPLSMGFPRHKYWSELPFLSPGDLSNPGIEPMSSVSPALKKDSLRAEPLRKPNELILTPPFSLAEAQSLLASWGAVEVLLWPLIFHFCSMPFISCIYSAPLAEGRLTSKQYKVFFVLFLFWGAVLHSLWVLGSPTRNWIWATIVKVMSPNHWTTREFPNQCKCWRWRWVDSCSLSCNLGLSWVTGNILLENVCVASQCWASFSSIISQRPHHLDSLLPHRDFLVHTELRLIQEPCSCSLNSPICSQACFSSCCPARAPWWAGKVVHPYCRLWHYHSEVACVTLIC